MSDSCDIIYIKDIFRTKTDIARIFLEHEWIFFLWVNVTFYDAVKLFMTSLQHLIHFHILLNSCLSVLDIIKLIKSDLER